MTTKSRELLLWCCGQIVLVSLIAAALSGRAVAGPHEDANAADQRGDYATELQILQPQAAQGHAWAENNLGNMYLFGNGVRTDNTIALAWFSKAAAQGDAGGEFNAGQIYEKGLDVPSDPGRAASLYRKVGEQGRKDGWSMLKRLCDHDKTLTASQCAGIPTGTQSAPELDFSQGKLGKLIVLAFEFLAACVALFFAVKQLRARIAAMKKADADAIQSGVGNANRTKNFASFFLLILVGSVTGSALIIAPLTYVIFQNPDRSPWSPAMVLWDVAVVLGSMVLLRLGARKLAAARARGS